MKMFVIAGNKNEAENWIRGDLEKRSRSGVTTLSRSEYVYVADSIAVKGWRNPHGVFIGTWRERRDIKDVLFQIHVQSTGSNQKILELISEING